MVAAAQTPPVLCASSGAAAARGVHLKEEYVRTRRESLRANAEVSVLNRQLASTRNLAASRVAAAGSQLAQSELAVALLSGELVGADDELTLAHRAIRTLSTSRHVLIQEVRELRALLAEGGGERHADLVAARDAALESLGAQEGRVRELQLSVTELSEQLRRQQIALKAGCELADEAVRVERAHAEELERVRSSHEAEVARLDARLSSAEAEAEAMGQMARREAARAARAEEVLCHQRARARARVRASREGAAEAAREELRALLLEEQGLRS